MFQKGFFLGIVVTMLVGAIVIIALLYKENRKLKSGKPATPTVSVPPDVGIKEGDAEPVPDGNATEGESAEEEAAEKKSVYPDASGIPIDWICSVYKLKNSWVNEIATANLLQIKLYGNLGKVVVIANCKFIDKETEGFRLILEDPYGTIKTELIPTKTIPESEVNKLIGNILIVDGVSENKKFKVKRIRKSAYAKKCI